MSKVDIISNEKQVVSKRRTVCPNCGKSFYMPVYESSIYKFTNKSGKIRIFCGWNCYNAGKQINDSGKRRRGWF